MENNEPKWNKNLLDEKMFKHIEKVIEKKKKEYDEEDFYRYYGVFDIDFGKVLCFTDIETLKTILKCTDKAYEMGSISNYITIEIKYRGETIACFDEDWRGGGEYVWVLRDEK